MWWGAKVEAGVMVAVEVEGRAGRHLSPSPWTKKMRKVKNLNLKNSLKTIEAPMKRTLQSLLGLGLIPKTLTVRSPQTQPRLILPLQTHHLLPPMLSPVIILKVLRILGVVYVYGVELVCPSDIVRESCGLFRKVCRFSSHNTLTFMLALLLNSLTGLLFSLSIYTL
jgi:hypothetical protein